jgi:hypothetical protein
MKIGDKYICEKSIYNIFNKPLFIKGKIYKILEIDGDHIVLDHILYSNEYMGHKKSILKKFKKYED